MIILVLSVLSQQHTNSEWNPCQIVEVYHQLQVYSAKNFDIVCVCIYIYVHMCISLHTYMCIYIYISPHTKFAAVVCLEEGQFLTATENWVKFLILWHRMLRLIFSIKEGQNFDPMKV
jgi:hypothetical protein